MKQSIYRFCVFFTLALVLLIIPRDDAEAATLDLNGSIIDMEQSDGDIVLENGTTMISENFLQDDLYLNVGKNGKQFSLENNHGNFCLEGAIGENTLSFDEKSIALPVSVSEKDGMLYFPLRPLLELFGTVDWNGETQDITVRYDYNDQMTLSEVTLANQPAHYEILTDSGDRISSGSKAIRQTDQGMLCEKVTEENYVTAVTLDGKPLIEPLHEQHIILGRCYAVEDDYLYWIEYPDPRLEATSNQQWYLYLQERTDGAEPICVDQGDFAELKNINFGEYILQNCDFHQGNIIWLRGDGATKELQVRLYQHETGETVTLDSASLEEQSNVTMEVALGDNDAIWTKSYLVESARQYGTMYRYHLESQEREVFSEGFNLLNPIITGDYLITRLKPEGNNFVVNEATGEYLSGVLWVYDLINNEWKFQITSQIPELEDNLVIALPSVLDSTHIVLNFSGAFENNKMIIVDLQSGQAYHLEDDDGISLEYDQSGWHDGLVVETQMLGDDGTSMMTILRQKNNSLESTSYPVKIEW